jgi:hypothetical protein
MIKNRLSESFETNLSEFIEANNVSVPNDFKIARELELARSALQDARDSYLLVRSSLKKHIDKLIEKEELDSTETLALTRILDSLNDRVTKLTKQIKETASIAKMGAEIESLISSRLDAAQVYSIISQLPSLLHAHLMSRLIAYITSNNLTINNSKVLEPEEVSKGFADEATIGFSELIEQQINVLTYRREEKSEDKPAVVEEQVVAMLNSVPRDEGKVLDADSDDARRLRNS